MPLKTSAIPSGKKTASAMHGVISKPKHPTGKKSVPPKRNGKPPAPRKAVKKARRHPGAFSTLRARQQAVERAKLQIWRHLQEINGAVIRLAESGSYLAARTLFEFAGVYSLPPLEEDAATTCPPAAPPATEGAPSKPLEKTAPAVNKIEAFLQTLGVDTLSDEEPEPDVAA